MIALNWLTKKNSPQKSSFFVLQQFLLVLQQKIAKQYLVLYIRLVDKRLLVLPKQNFHDFL